MFDWYKDTKSLFNKDDFVKIYIDCPRDVLLKRIKIRTQKINVNLIILNLIFLELKEEVKDLYIIEK